MTRRHTWHGAYDASPARWGVPEPTPLDPRPVQLRRGRRCPDHTILVAEPSHWASGACTASSTQHRGAAIAEYAVHLAGRPDLTRRRSGRLDAQSGPSATLAVEWWPSSSWLGEGCAVVPIVDGVAACAVPPHTQSEWRG
jgi:hypothetical protein